MPEGAPMARILVVDDELLLRVMLKDALEEAGHAVMLAENGGLAIDCAKTQRPDLILMDVMMPGLDGFDTCKAMKADPALRGVPVVLISATIDPKGVVDRAKQVGAVTALPKPVPIDLLQQVLDQVVEPS
jgi:CheY-like chemotaxis protein